MQNKDGKLIEIITDSDSKKPMTVPAYEVTDEYGSASQVEGQYAYGFITFPNFIEGKDSIETADFVIPKAKGWEMTGLTRVILTHTDSGAQIDVTEDEEKTVEGALASIEDLRARLKKEISYTTENVVVCELDAVKCHYDMGTTQRYIYIVSYFGEVYRIGVTIPTEYEDKVDFEEVVDSIRFR